MSETTETTAPKRPLILTVICVVLMLTALMAMQVLSSGEFSGLPRPFLIAYLVKIVLTPIAVLGIFFMRRWGVLLYVFIAILGQATQLKYGTLNPIYLALELAIIGVIMLCYRQMRW